MSLGCVYLIGAGCGEADLITLRGLERLHQCDAVVYDDLIASELLELAPAQAERLYMGKRQGKHSAAQEEISNKLIELAQAGKRVARLKGGDPFVFGRGGEEILALQAAGIPYEEIPGISSAIAIPAAAGIPVTHRGLSRSFHVITGHTADTADSLPPGLEELAKLEGTLIFLMGLGLLPRIAAKLMECGKDPDTAAAVLSGGNSPHPATVRGTLADIAERARGVQPPAVVVVGGVAALDLSPTLPRPLDGVRVGIIGTAEIAHKQCSALRDVGAVPTWISRSVVRELPVDFDLYTLAERPRWVVFTSANGVKVFFRQLARQKMDIRSLRDCKFAVIGPATGEALAQHGIYAELCPEIHTSRALALALRETACLNEEIFLFRSAKGSPVLSQILTEAGFTVRDVPTYDLTSEQLHPFPPPTLDYLTFASAGSVELFFQQYGTIPERTRCVCIGPVTAAALSKHTNRPFLTAEDISVAGIVQTISNDCK